MTEYNLPDIQILNSSSNQAVYIWNPDNIYIVLGRSNSSEGSVNLDTAIKDGVTIIKRPTGGESVVLSPNMLVFSAKIDHKNSQKPIEVFNKINKHLITQLTNIGIKNLNSKGISDLSIGEKKILGSSMMLKDNIFFYHAVLNINEDPSIISKYLKHPKKEPDYRKGREHKQFVTSLKLSGYNIDKELIEHSIYTAFNNLFSEKC